MCAARTRYTCAVARPANGDAVARRPRRFVHVEDVRERRDLYSKHSGVVHDNFAWASKKVFFYLIFLRHRLHEMLRPHMPLELKRRERSRVQSDAIRRVDSPNQNLELHNF